MDAAAMSNNDKGATPQHCDTCDLDKTRNPHPDAGSPSALCETGYIWECIPCLVKTRAGWADRARKAEREADETKSALIGARVLIEELRAAHEASQARAARLEEALKELVRQITKFAEEQGEADFYTGDATKALAESPNSWLQERLKAEREPLEKNAARYLWLRRTDKVPGMAFIAKQVTISEQISTGRHIVICPEEDLDAEISAAIRALPEGE